MKGFIKTTLMVIGLGVVALFLIGVGIGISKGKSESTQAQIVITPSAPAEEQAVPKEITMAQYKTLRDGMTYKQVVKILGREGEEISSDSAGGMKCSMYQWANPDSIANMNATFMNGRLNGKAQLGFK
jgi:hypothetical protein